MLYRLPQRDFERNPVELAEEFDELRLIRNDINYYGKEVSIIEAKEVLKRLENLRANLLKLTSTS